MSMEEASVQSPEVPEVILVPNDAVTKLTVTKSFSVAKVLATVSAIIVVPIMVIAGLLILSFIGMLIGNIGDVKLYPLVCVIMVICIIVRVSIDMVLSAFALSRVANSFKYGLHERQASLKFLSRVTMTVSVIQWVAFVLLVFVWLQHSYEKLTSWNPNGLKIGLIVVVLLAGFIHTMSLQMIAMGVRRFRNGTADKQNSFWCAIGLIIAGVFELGNILFVVIQLISANALKYIFSVEALAAPFFTIVAFVIHGVCLMILGILLMKKSRKEELFDCSA